MSYHSSVAPCGSLSLYCARTQSDLTLPIEIRELNFPQVLLSLSQPSKPQVTCCDCQGCSDALSLYEDQPVAYDRSDLFIKHRIWKVVPDLQQIHHGFRQAARGRPHAHTMIRAVSSLAWLIAKSKRPTGSTRRRKICTERDQSRFEEEQLPWYRPDQFYPVHIGEVFKERYHVVGKLGYGAHSTVWLCRDRQNASFVALKICTRGIAQASDRELRFYEHLSSLDSQHPGQAYVRGLFEAFKIESHTGDHLCLVQPPMHMTIRELQRQNESRRLTEQLLKWTLSNVLSALSFLHDDALVIHTDINPSNIMLTIADQSILFDFEKQEAQNPSPKKVVESGRAIYGTRRLGLPKDSLWGQPVLCDFGEARIGQVHNGLIQPELYRAPEVLFGMEWTSSADIWNVATLIWDLFEDRHLFNALDENHESPATHHIAEMVSFLGLPPLEYLRRSEITRNVFHENGSWKSAGGVSLPPISLEKAVLYLEGEEKRRFLDFVRSMLTWLPEERKRATEILEDPWLRGGSF